MKSCRFNTAKNNARKGAKLMRYENLKQTVIMLVKSL